MAYLLREGGALVVVEFAWDQFDEATARWALERLPDVSSSSVDPSWLKRCCQEWADGSRGEVQLPAKAYFFAGWASEEGLHGSRRMLSELQRRFVGQLFAWVPYLYPNLDVDISEADESAAIEAGAINATGFLYVGTLALEEEHFQAHYSGLR